MNNVLSNRLAALQRRSEENLIAFLRTEVDVGLTLAGVAKTARSMGHESWERSVQHAEDAYTEVALFLINPQYAERMPDEQRRKIEAAMEKLRKTLGALPGSNQQGAASNRLPTQAAGGEARSFNPSLP